MRIFLFKEYERIKKNLSTFDRMDYRIIEISLDPRRITSLKFPLLLSSAEKKSGVVHCKETIPSSSRLSNLQCFRFVMDVLKQLNTPIIKSSTPSINEKQS